MSTLNAYFYLLEAEQMPVDAPDEWFLQPEAAARSEEEITAFSTNARLLLEDIRDMTTEEEIQSVFYARAKNAFGDDKSSIREFFRLMYLLIFHVPQGPRWGQFVVLFGRDKFIERLAGRLDNPFAY